MSPAAQKPDKRGGRRNAVRATPPQPTTQRGRETRARLKQAGLAVFNRTGYPSTRIQDIMAEAGSPVSLFYRYFRSKEQLALEILEELYEEMNRRSEEAGPGSAFDRVLVTNGIITEYYARYPGLMRSMVSFHYDEPEFIEFFRRIAMEQNRRVADNLARRFPDCPLSAREHHAIAHMAGAMVEHFLFKRYVLCNSELCRRFKTEQQVALFLSIMWYRLLFRANPPADKMGEFIDLRDMSLVM